MKWIFLLSDPTLPFGTDLVTTFALIMRLRFVLPQPADRELLPLYIARLKVFASPAMMGTTRRQGRNLLQSKWLNGTQQAALDSVQTS